MQEVPQGAMPAAPMPTAPVQQDALYLQFPHDFCPQLTYQNVHSVIYWCMQEMQQGAMPATLLPTAHVQQAQQERLYI